MVKEGKSLKEKVYGQHMMHKGCLTKRAVKAHLEPMAHSGELK